MTTSKATALPPDPMSPITGGPLDEAALGWVGERLPAGWRLAPHASVSSTSDLAREAGTGGAAEGLVVWAAEQTQGRGRLGRSWGSPPGNLYCSVLLRPSGPVARMGELTFVTALALADALVALPGLPAVSLKWPNDVLVGGAKIAGILLEGAPRPDGYADWVVIGTGINIAFHPDTAVYPCTSLAAALAEPPTPAELLVGYANRLAHRYRQWQAEGFVAIRRDWLARAGHLGETLTARLPDGSVTGVFRDLDEDGHLILDLGDGTTRTIAAGDIFFADD